MLRNLLSRLTLCGLGLFLPLPASGHSDGAAQIIRSHAHARGYVSRSQVPGHRVAHAGQQGRHLTGKSGAGSGIIQQTALPGPFNANLKEGTGPLHHPRKSLFPLPLHERIRIVPGRKVHQVNILAKRGQFTESPVRRNHARLVRVKTQYYP